MKHTKKLAILIIFLCINCIVLFFLSQRIKPTASPTRAYESYVKGSSPQTFTYIRSNLSTVISSLGIEETINLLKYAFREEHLTMYECHTLAHMTGHFSRLQMTTNIQIAKKIGLDFCEGGFKHGLEAEIALEGIRLNHSYKDTLYDFCQQLTKIVTTDQYLDCYHGAGHEFMRETMEVSKALTLCEDLIHDELTDVQNCYKGVFSELTNLVGGFDGETGEILSNGPPISIKEHPIEFCASLKDIYQEPCGFELSGNLNDRNAPLSQVESILLRCVDDKYPPALEAICLQSLSAVSTQHLLPKHPTLTAPAKILSLSPLLRQSYMKGAGYEMKEFIKKWTRKRLENFL